MEYTATFMGKLIGAIGISYPHTVKVTADSPAAARLALYETHDHIQQLTLNVPTPVKAQLIYWGMVDYWGGDSRRWDMDKACAFASYCPDTTLEDMLDSWASDEHGLERKGPWEDITTEQIQAALLNMLTAQGLVDLESGKPCEFAEALDPADWPKDSDGNYTDDEYPTAIVLLTVAE